MTAARCKSSWQVQQIQATERAFDAILADGSVVTRGEPMNGGDFSRRPGDPSKSEWFCSRPGRWFRCDLGPLYVWRWQQPGARAVGTHPADQTTDGAFAAILADGSVVTWGDHDAGGDSSQVQEQLVGIQQIQATQCAFAVVAWLWR